MSLILGACGQVETTALEDEQYSQTQSNGINFNGINFNGINFNGINFNGINFNGTQLNGINFNGSQLNGINFNGSQLSGTQNGSVVSGPAMVGAVMNVTVSSLNKQVLVKFDAIYNDPMSAASDVYLYDVTYQVAGTTTWTSLCQDSNGGPVPGTIIANYWDTKTGNRINDPSVFTFACVNGALGKCVRWGYRPWATGTRCTGGTCSTVSLQDYHQACTRMVRADYCGDGQANTVNGTPIDVYDGLSPQIQSPETTWLVEARWNARGATCLGNTRGADLINKFKYPDCSKTTGYSQKKPFPACAETDYTVSGSDLLGDNYNSQNNVQSTSQKTR